MYIKDRILATCMETNGGQPAQRRHIEKDKKQEAKIIFNPRQFGSDFLITLTEKYIHICYVGSLIIWTIF